MASRASRKRAQGPPGPHLLLWETHLDDLQGPFGKVDIENLRQGDSSVQVHCEEEMVQSKALWGPRVGPADPLLPLASSQPFLLLGLSFPYWQTPIHPTKLKQNCPFSVLSSVAPLSRASSEFCQCPAHSGPHVLTTCLYDYSPLDCELNERTQVRQLFSPESAWCRH